MTGRRKKSSSCVARRGSGAHANALGLWLAEHRNAPQRTWAVTACKRPHAGHRAPKRRRIKTGRIGHLGDRVAHVAFDEQQRLAWLGAAAVVILAESGNFPQHLANGCRSLARIVLHEGIGPEPPARQLSDECRKRKREYYDARLQPWHEHTMALAHVFAEEPSSWTLVEDVVEVLMAADNYGRPVAQDDAVAILRGLCAAASLRATRRCAGQPYRRCRNTSRKRATPRSGRPRRCEQFRPCSTTWANAERHRRPTWGAKPRGRDGAAYAGEPPPTKRRTFASVGMDAAAPGLPTASAPAALPRRSACAIPSPAKRAAIR